MAGELTVVFRTKTGEEEAKVFTQQPLGMDFQGNMPIVINRLRGKSQADQLGVQVGWEVLSINNIALTGQTFHDARDIVVKLAATLPGYMLVRKCPPYVKSTEQLSSKLKRVEEAEVMPFLQQFGFVARSADVWGEKAQRPELGLGVVDDHREKGHHTWYAIIGKVQVTSPGTVSPTRRWQVERRLAHIRALLHDPVKRELGKDYDFHFNGAHFPHHGGPSGTTARMEAWLEALSRPIKSGELSPALVASILSFLEAPQLDEDAGQAISESATASDKASVGGTTMSAPLPTTASTFQVTDQQEEQPLQDCPDDKTDSGADDGAEEGAEEAATEAAAITDASSSRLKSFPAMEHSEDLNEAALAICL